MIDGSNFIRAQSVTVTRNVGGELCKNRRKIDAFYKIIVHPHYFILKSYNHGDHALINVETFSFSGYGFATEGDYE